MLRNTHEKYGALAKGLHWLMAVFIIGMLIVGFIMTDMAATPDKFKLYGLHKSLGIFILVLGILRLGWRVMNVVPLLPNTLKKMEKLLAHLGHWLLYALIIAMPLSGWVMSSASGFPVSVFGWFVLPDLVAPDMSLKALMLDVHEYMAYAIIALVSVHVLAALLHHFYYKDNVLLRMLPLGKVEVKRDA